MIYYLFLLALEAGKSKIKAPARECLVRAHLLVYGWLSSYFVFPWQKEGVKEFSGVSFIRDLSPFMTASAS